jgi:phage-related protein
MAEESHLKPVIWVGSSRHDLRQFPSPVQDRMGYALYVAQCGSKHVDAKPLSGFGGAGVLELVEDYRGDTFRAVYTLRYADRVFVLHAFQKKSKRGAATPLKDIELVRQRLRVAEQIAKELEL